ncbi:MAG: hypothetical protein ACOYM9_02165 [Bradymonadia bacterium]
MTAPLNAPVVLGHGAVERLAGTLETSLPALRRAPPRVLSNGGVEVRDPVTADALHLVQHMLEAELPTEVLARIVQKSGLAFPVFLGHVLDYWLSQRGRMGFLRVFVDRAGLHGIDLRLHWNEGRTSTARLRPAGNTPLVIGTAAGFVVGSVAQRFMPWDNVLPLLCAGLGLTAGHLWQRRVLSWDCGDRLCRAPLARSATVCPGCGASVLRPGEPRR